MRQFWAIVAVLVGLGALRADDAVTDLGQLEVTAEKRVERLQLVPQSVTSLSAEELAAAGVDDLREAAHFVPNLFFSGFDPRHTAYPFFRGLGSGQGEPVVTTYVDDVPQLTANTVDTELLDTERLEFVRGPQGTLYGRNTLGGVIHQVTRLPSRELTLEGSAQFGSDRLQRYKLYLSGPLGAGETPPRYSLAATHTSRDGYTMNRTLGDTVDDRDTVAARAQLLLEPAPNVDVRFALFGERDRDGAFVLYDVESLRDDPHTIYQDFDGETARDILAPSMTISVYGDGYDFVSVTAYEYWRTSAQTDLDFTAADFQRRFTDERQHQWFQELRLQSPVDEPLEVNLISSLHWLIGASFFYADLDNETVNEIRPGSPPIFAPVSLYQSARYDLADLGAALFGQATLEVNDQLRLTAGLRYEWERKEAELNLASPLPPAVERRALEDDFAQVLPRVEVAYEWTQRLMTYVSAAKGYRAGGYNRNTLPGGPYTYEEETSWTYETGVKSTWYDGRLRLNAAVFYTDWKDMQLDVPNPLSPIPGTFVLDNVGEARSQGFEVEGAAQLGRGWTLFGGVGYVDAEFADYDDPATGADLSGNDLPNVPDVTWHAALEYRREVAESWSWYARGELVGLGDINYDAANGAGQNDVVLANLRLGLLRDRWGVEAWIENVTDEVYIPVAIASPFSPSGYAGRPGAPRTFGCGLSYRF